MHDPVEDPECFVFPVICRTEIEKIVREAIRGKEFTPDWYDKFVSDVQDKTQESITTSREALDISKRNSEDIKDLKKNQADMHEDIVVIKNKLPVYESMMRGMNARLWGVLVAVLASSLGLITGLIILILQK